MGAPTYYGGGPCLPKGKIMAGINLADQLREGRSGSEESPASNRSYAAPSSPKIDFGAEDRFRIIILVLGIASILGVKHYVKEYTDKLGIQKEAEVTQLESQI